MLIECAEVLRARGHQIAVVAAGSQRVADWARSRTIDVVDMTDPNSDWQAELGQHRFEWLFAITHLAILPDAVGRAELRGTVWSARNAGTTPLLKGQRCSVTAIDRLMIFIKFLVLAD